MNTPPSARGLGAFIRWSPNPTIVFDRDLKALTANDAFLLNHRTNLDALLGKGVDQLLPGALDGRSAEVLAHVSESLRTVLKTGLPHRMPLTRYDVSPSPSGDVPGALEERYWEPMSYPVLDDQGQVLYIIHQAEDVTELIRLRQAEAEKSAELAEALSLYQAVYDQGIFAGRLDTEGRVVDVNRSSLEQCGFTREEVVGRPFWECGWWNRSSAVKDWVKRAFQQALRGEPFRGVSTYFLADGTERVVEFACVPVKDREGLVTSVVPTGIDITERASAERDHRATSILESITDSFVSLDANWRFTYVNRQAERVLGRRPGDLIGKLLWDEYPGIAGTEFEQAFRKAAHEKLSSSVTAYFDDHRRWYEVHTYPAADGVSIYFRDVTEQVVAGSDRSRLVAASERQRLVYEAALSNTPDLVYIFDLDHRFTYANEALLKMWGKTREEALGRNCLELGYEPWHAEMHDREIDRVVATGRPVRGEVPFTGTDGTRDYDYIFAPVIGADGSVVAIAGTTRDVTDRKRVERAIREQAEQLRQNDRRKDEFLAMLAHELRNPLAAIGNAVGVTARGGVRDNAEWALDVIARQTDHLTRLIDDLLDVSRINRGKIDLRNRTLDLALVLGNAAETVRPLLVERGHHLELTAPRDALWTVGDPTRLEQVVVNLLNNAARYSENGARIRLSGRLEGAEVVVSVADNGVGIPPDTLPQMFELFAQGDRSLARSEGGLGIGLTVVKKLVELHGGTVTATSEGPGHGSEFTIRLPAASRPAGAGPAPSARHVARPAPRSPGGARVLVVDDNVDTATGMARLLRLLGHEVATAHTGPDALEIARRQAPQYVLLDIGLPGMDGYQVASRLRDEPGCENAVLIAVSGYGLEEDRRRSREAGFDHHLLKPLDHDALISLLSTGGKVTT